MAVKNRNLPNLPKGEGSMSFTTVKGQEYIVYRKMVNGSRKAVYGESAKECFSKMRNIEKESFQMINAEVDFNMGRILLGEAISNWHDTVKRNVLKNKSWDREHHTIENQIKKYGLSKIQVHAVDARLIQQHINILIYEESYSYSTVKKTYEILNQFFKYYYALEPHRNPMNLVPKPTKNGMNERPKEVEYFDTEDLQLFIREATKTYANGKPKYKYGYAFLIMILTLCRVGEVMALRWKNINIEAGEIYIKEAMSKVIDHNTLPEYGRKNSYKLELTTPKYDSIRTVYMNPECKQFFEKFRELQMPVDEYEWFLATDKKTIVSERNLRRCLNNIQEAAGMKVQNSGFHVLRHTGITLMAKAGIDEMVVARIAGQKDLQMIHNVYRHVSEYEKIEALNKVTNLGNMNFLN